MGGNLISMATVKTHGASGRRAGILLAAVAAVAAWGIPAHADVVAWSDLSGTDHNWSNPANWNPAAAPTASSDVLFDDTSARTAAGTVTNTVNSSLTINSLSYLQTGGSANAHTTEIASGQTLTIAPTVANTTNTAVLVNNGATSSTYAVITGPGALVVNGGTTYSFNVAAAAAGGQANHTLDMSSLSSFTATASNFNIGTGARNAGIVNLAATNNITATNLTVGNNTATGGGLSRFTLGQTNTLNINSMLVGAGRSSGILQFATGLVNPTVTIAGSTNATANLTIGTVDTNASGGTPGTVDFSGGILNGAFGTITVGRSANGSGGANGTGNLLFGAGTLTATTINAGLGNNGTSITATGIGNVTMTAGAGTLTVTNVNLGVQTNGSGANAGNGTFNQNGGTAVITTLTLGNRTSSAAAGGTITGTYNLAGGSLFATSIKPGGNGTGTATMVRNFNWTGGALTANTVDVTSVGANVNHADAGTGILFNDGGTLAPGGVATTGLTTITGNYTVSNLNGTAAFAVDLNGAAASTAFQDATGGFYDTVAVSGAASLGGNLNVSVLGSFDPASNVTYTILNAASGLSGAFANAPTTGSLLTTADGKWTYQVNYGANAVTLTNFAAAAAPVPEPASVGILAIAGMGLLLRSRRRR
jgi:hypothetical protein